MVILRVADTPASLYNHYVIGNLLRKVKDTFYI